MHPSSHRRLVALAALSLAAVALAPPGPPTAAAPTALTAAALDGTIAFVCEQDGGTNDEICLMDADGTARTRLTDSPGPDRAPNWNAASDALVFNSRRGDHGDRPQIYRLDVASGAATRVSDGPLEDQRGSWTPDGTGVIYQRGTFDAGYQLQRQDLASGTVTALTAEPGTVNAAGSLDPSGTRLLHQSNRDADGLFPFGTYVTDLATGTTTRLAPTVTASHDGPRWSPDAAQVAFAAGGALHVVDLASGAVEQVTDGGASDSSPGWSPDGTMLVFQSDRLDPDLDDDVDVTSIHVLDLASGDVIDLGEGRTPVWSSLDHSPDEPSTTTTGPPAPTTTTGVAPTPLPAVGTAGVAPAAAATPMAGRPTYAG